jgi:hypothetical protein
VFTPTEVAKALNMDKHVTSTIVHRLENDGEIRKTGRGEYVFTKEINTDIANEIYRNLYRGVAENIGLRAIEAMTNMKESDFNKDEPVDSLITLAIALQAWFGEEAVYNIMINLEKRYEDHDDFVSLIKDIKENAHSKKK